MKPMHISIAALVVSISLVSTVSGQAPSPVSQGAVSAAPSAAAAEVPRLIKFSGTLLDVQERPLAGPVGVTFALYAQQSGGAALWLETQNVKPDASGNYTVLLGTNTASGVPAELFVSNEARWLGIQVGQLPEHDRILLVSVPYALKAGDAETLGGLPASAFVTTGLANTANAANSAAATSTSSTAGKMQPAAGASTKTGATPQAATPCTSVTSDGAAAVSSIGLFTTACNMEGSLMSQATINGFPGINLAGNNAGLLLNGAGTHQVTVTGATSGRLGQDASGFFFASDTKNASVRFLTNNGTLNEWMRITSAGKVGIGTTSPTNPLVVATPGSTGLAAVVATGGTQVISVGNAGDGGDFSLRTPGAPAFREQAVAARALTLAETAARSRVELVGASAVMALTRRAEPVPRAAEASESLAPGAPPRGLETFPGKGAFSRRVLPIMARPRGSRVISRATSMSPVR